MPLPTEPSVQALSGADGEAAPRSVDALQTAMQKIGQAVYAQAGGSSENGTDG